MAHGTQRGFGLYTLAPRAVKIEWVGLLDAQVYTGGGELGQRDLIDAGRRRGHVISESPFLRRRPQRVLRRSRIYRGLRVDWDADLFVLANLRNAPRLGLRIPDGVVARALSTGRAAVLADAWVDTCELDMPCGGNPVSCPATCDRAWANWLWGNAAIAVFLSPMQERMVESVLDVPLPRLRIVRRPYIDVERFRPLGLQRDIDVLYVGHIDERKGYSDLVRSFGAERLTLVGRNGLEGPLAGTYLGEFPHERLPEIYNRARVFAHLPQWFEPMGRTVIEAALCGCEIVVNDRVGAMSFEEPERSDPAVVRRSLDRFGTSSRRQPEPCRQRAIDSGERLPAHRLAPSRHHRPPPMAPMLRMGATTASHAARR